jgi:hypothetical protein
MTAPSQQRGNLYGEAVLSRETLSHVESSRIDRHRYGPGGHLGDASAGGTPNGATQDDHFG